MPGYADPQPNERPATITRTVRALPPYTRSAPVRRGRIERSRCDGSRATTARTRTPLVPVAPVVLPVIIITLFCNRINHTGLSMLFTISPRCIFSNAVCHSVIGHIPPIMGFTSNCPLAISAITRSHMGQLWLKLPWSLIFF